MQSRWWILRAYDDGKLQPFYRISGRYVHHSARLHCRAWALGLQTLPNVAFYVQLPYSPELNPIEQLWALLKIRPSNGYLFDLEEFQQTLSYQLEN